MSTKLSTHLTKSILFAAVLLAGISTFSFAQNINTIVGNGIPAYSGDGGSALLAQLDHPKGVAIDAAGNVFIADAGNNVIRKINTGGIISTFAGNGTPGYSGDGLTATAASLNAPNGVAFDSLGNLYICDADNYCVRKVNTSGIMSTYAGTGGVTGYSGDGFAATAAEMTFPGGIALDPSGNLFITDEYNHCVRKVNIAGIITTFAGAGGMGYTGDNGPATAANIGFPFGIACDGYGNVYISQTLNNRILKVNTSGIVNNLAGDGTNGFLGDGSPATAGEFDTPWGIASDGAGNVYVADNANERIRKITPADTLFTVAGNGSSGYFGDGGLATNAKLRDPAGVAVSPDGSIYIADYNNHAVRKIAGPWTHPPTFTGGHLQTMPACDSPVNSSVNPELAITDPDVGQFEMWQVVSLPLHGTLFSPYAAVSTGGVITPVGLFYVGHSGYFGLDSFRVRVTDGTASDTTMVHLSVAPCVPDAVNALNTDNKDNPIKILPNPNAGAFTLSLFSSSNERAKVTITNLLGRKVREFNTITNTPIEINLDEPPGIYLLGATSAHNTWNGKILVDK
jgi:sugar lactone lactonase YvrE